MNRYADLTTFRELKQLIDPKLYDEHEKFIISSGDAAWFICTSCASIVEFAQRYLALSEDYIPKTDEEGSFILTAKAFKKAAEHFNTSTGSKYVLDAFKLNEENE
jgi:hypothetical protein